MKHAITFALIGILAGTVGLSFAALLTGHSAGAVLAVTTIILSPLCALIGVTLGAMMRR